MRIRLAKEHVTPAASSVGGEHKRGSAIDWFQTTAPTTRPDGVTALTTDDRGRTWCDTTNNVLKMLTAIGSPNTWTPYGELCIATYTAGSEPTRGIYRKGNEIYVKTDAEKHLAGLIDEDNMASNSATRVPSQQSVRAYVTSGTVTMANKTLTSPTINTPTIASAVLNTAVSGTAVLDEDTMASNSATKLATQQSIKAYVDNSLGQSAQVVGTTNISTNTADWSNMTDMSITMTTKGGNVLALFTATFEANSDSDNVTVGLRYDLDGTPYGTQQHCVHNDAYSDSSGEERMVHAHWLFTGLAAGSHTFKVQWKDVAHIAYQYGADFPRVLSIVELPS